LKIVNRTVPEGLPPARLQDSDIEKIIAHVAKYDTIEDVQDAGQSVASGLRIEHLDVFDCASNLIRACAASVTWRISR